MPAMGRGDILAATLVGRPIGAGDLSGSAGSPLAQHEKCLGWTMFSTDIQSDGAALIVVRPTGSSLDLPLSLESKETTGLLHALRLAVHADGIILIKSEDGRSHYVGEDAVAPMWLGHSFPHSECLSGRAIADGEPIVIRDLQAGGHSWRTGNSRAVVRSLAIIPLAPLTRLALGMYWSHPTDISPDVIDIARSYGDVLSTVLAMASELERLKSLLDKRQLEYDELAHRHKNALASASGIGRLTLPRAPAAEFSARMHALGVVQCHLDPRGKEFQTAEVGSLFAEILAPYQQADNWPIRLHGGIVALSSAQAVALGLIVNELATNALKHGALSGDGGSVVLGWERNDDEIGVVWRELSTATHDASSEGEGTGLLKRLAELQLKGRLDRRFLPDGLECRIVFGIE